MLVRDAFTPSQFIGTGRGRIFAVRRVKGGYQAVTWGGPYLAHRTKTLAEMRAWLAA